MRSLFVGVTLLSAACGSTTVHGHGRGSAACQDWQDAICDYAANRCGALTRDECDTNYQAVTCKSDALAMRCAQQLNAASCGQASASCDIDAVADPAPATQACDDLLQRFCARAVVCGVADSQDACRSIPDVRAINCGAAIAYGLDYEACVDEIDSIDCAILRLPAICDNVIILHG